MDSLTIALQFVREELERVGRSTPAANDPQVEDRPDMLAAAIAKAEVRARRVLGGTKHYIRRDAKTDTLQRLADMPPDLTPKQIAERTGMSVRHVQEMKKLLDDTEPRTN